MNRSFLWTALAVTLGSVLVTSPAFANLQVFPTRVILNDQKKAAHLSLRHMGDTPEKYRIMAVFYRMTPDGGMQLVKDASEPESAVKLLRFSPREVMLAPRMEQVLRVMFHSPKPVEEGEYRAHLLFEPTSEAPAADTNAGGKVKTQLTAKLAIAVPIIYRKGKPKISVSLSDLKLTRVGDNKPAFSITVNQEGRRFLFGDLQAHFTPEGGTSQLVGLVNGFSSYIPKRSATYALAVPEGLSLQRGTLRVDCKEAPDEGGQILATTEVRIP
ncbi:MAG TPA: hypothetical protein VJB59_03150 [Bdellovibrionota bacterium]|nr:hypothetical protein [Bdellovibrionota bacterium]